MDWKPADGQQNTRPTGRFSSFFVRRIEQESREASTAQSAVTVSGAAPLSAIIQLSAKFTLSRP
jgi:hypothetical protein